MKRSILLIFAFLTFAPITKADVGINAGFGVPFLTQYGLNATFGSKWSASLEYNLLDLSSGAADVKLSMPAVVMNWHPFEGSFYLGLGVGSESLEVSASDSTTGGKAEADVSATTLITRLGWMWGKDNGGLWFGMDISFISPSGGEVDIKTSGGLTTADQAYKDAEDSGKKFAETAYANITFARLGYLF